jgi:hypothetical protein
MDVQILESWLAEGLTLEQMGERASKHPSTIGYWLKKYGLAATNHERFAPKGGIEREALAALVEEGLSVREIAARLDRSISTVRHWLHRHSLQTRRQEMSRQLVHGHRPAALERTCLHHGRVTYHRDRGGRYRCRRCVSEAVSRRRREVKRILVEEAGGRCRLCGYDRHVAALEFHHLDRAAKEFHLSKDGVARSLKRARAEAAKCILLCANCHAEVEAGYTPVPERRTDVQVPRSGS